MDACMFSSKSVEWETPPELFSALNDEFHFTVDAASTDENALCEKHWTKETDGLKQDWSKETVWCNPPYGRETGKWVRKASEEAEKGATVVMLIPCRPDVSYFHDYILGKAEIRFLRSRLRFNRGGVLSDRAPFPSMIVIYRGKGQEEKIND